MKQYIKYFIILIVIIGFIVGINYFFKPSIDLQMKNYLVSLGYQESNEYENLYIKEDSNTKKHSFSFDDYTFMLNQDDEYNDMLSSLNATYDFKNESIIYSYRVNYSDSVNVWFKGTYDTENFTCNKEFSSTELSIDSQNDICNLANSSIKLFDLEAKTLFTKYKFIDYIKNK